MASLYGFYKQVAVAILYQTDVDREDGGFPL
jgi:hypothetical protein